MIPISALTNRGRKGGSNSLLSNFSQSMEEKKAWLVGFARRRWASFSRSFRKDMIRQCVFANPHPALTISNNRFASLDKNLGYLTSSLQMLQNNSSSSLPEKGLCPTSISYNKTPNAHQSTC